MVELPFVMGKEIRAMLDNYYSVNNISLPPEIQSMSQGLRYEKFTEEELKLVTSLSVDDETFTLLRYFPNLKSVTLNGVYELDNEQIKYIVDRYSKLEELKIVGQDKLQVLDVSGLKNLKKLELISNKSLKKVIGLDQIPNIDSFTFYDNVTYTYEEELCEAYKRLSDSGTLCNIDVLYINNIMDDNLSHPENIFLSEVVGSTVANNVLTYNIPELKKAMDKAKEIISNYIDEKDTDIQKYAIIYQWICNNITYDNSNNALGVNANDRLGKIGGTNGTVNGLVYGSSICEGYTKGLQFILKMLDIPSFDIPCLADPNSSTQKNINGVKNNAGFGDHSIIKVNLDGNVYYSDVTWDAQRYQSKRADRAHFLLSLDDMKKNHVINGEDNVVSSNSISKEEFDKLMQFASERIESRDRELSEKESKKTPSDKVKELNQKIEELKIGYAITAKQMEVLLSREKDDSINKIKYLEKQRDIINDDLLENTDVKEDIEIRQEKEMDRNIRYIEDLLGIKITPYSRYESVEFPDKSVMDTIARPIYKNRDQLFSEISNINNILFQIYKEKKIDYDRYNELRNALAKKYEMMFNEIDLSNVEEMDDEVSRGR